MSGNKALYDLTDDELAALASRAFKQAANEAKRITPTKTVTALAGVKGVKRAAQRRLKPAKRAA